jgi:predicted DCC family thiol-disulfide oxidoreductase YuxK
MTAQPGIRVSNPPPKPVLIWDGECLFCRRWIERWKEITGADLDYETSRDLGERFPEVPREECGRSVILIEPDGAVSSGAKAVFRSLRSRRSKKWLAWSYEHVPGFAALSEAFYRIIAANRRFASRITSLLWGKDVRPPTYFAARRWFLRALGLIFLIAFVSLWIQIHGLIGSNGITSVSQLLPAAHTQLGDRAFWVLPTLCWFNSSDAFLHFLCGGGIVLSLFLIFGIAPALSLVGLVIFYLSFAATSDGVLNPFLSYQWDTLLIEVGFLSIFLAPWRLWWRSSSVEAGPSRTGIVSAANPGLQAGDTPATTEPPVSRAAMFLLKLLLFKLMLMSGVVKLTSYQLLQDPAEDTWWNLTALNYHYWSQPLPTVIGWWADQSPESFKHFSVVFCLVVEIVVPFFIWAPRRLRLLACALLIFLQVVIGLTGNYNFFNLLTIALCLLLIDDSVGTSRRNASPARTVRGQRSALSLPDRISTYAVVVVIVFTLPINLRLIYGAFEPEEEWSPLLGGINARLEPFRVVNGYGLFRVMTKDRKEIVVEGSADGLEWKPYEFKWKPGDVMRAPGWCQPHQPRLDWQMWFAALGNPRERVWFSQLIIALLRDKAPVTALFEKNPFAESPPHYVRATIYRYRFTTAEEHRQTGAWWKREELGEYLPSVSREDIR